MGVAPTALPQWSATEDRTASNPMGDLSRVCIRERSDLSASDTLLIDEVVILLNLNHICVKYNLG